MTHLTRQPSRIRDIRLAGRGASEEEQAKSSLTLRVADAELASSRAAGRLYCRHSGSLRLAHDIGNLLRGDFRLHQL